MKRLLILFFCFFVSVLAAKPVKVALTGDRNLVDLLTAELSSDKGIALLERSEIEKLLREHKLNASTLTPETAAKHFPHVDIFAVATEQRLIVFNAKNGFLLWSRKPDHPAEELRRAISKQSEKFPLYLAVVSIRDVGVPQKSKSKIGHFISRLMEMLLENPSVQLLERSNLGLVSAERELTEKRFALTPSACLLSLEFESENRNIKGKIILRDLHQKIIGRLENKDVFSDITSSSTEFCREITQLAKKQYLTVQRNREKEAARFFEEFTVLSKTQECFTPECRQKLEAALALAPDNPQYRYAEIRYLAELIRRTVGFPDAAAHWRAQWERCLKFRRQFPSWKANAVMYPSMVLPGLNRSRCRPGMPEYALAEKILDGMRLYARREEALWFPAPSPEKITSLKALGNFGRVLLRSSNSEYYLSLETCIREQLQCELEFFKTAEILGNSHPDLRRQIEEIFRRDGHWRAVFIQSCFFPDPLPVRRKILQRHFASPVMQEYQESASSSAFPFLRRQALLLKYMQKIINAPADKENGREILRQYFAELDRKFSGSMQLANQPTNWRHDEFHFGFREFLTIAFDDAFLYQNELNAYRKVHHKIGKWAAFEAAVTHGDLDELATHAATMRQFNYDRITKNRIANLYGSVLARLFNQEGNFKNKTAEKFFFDANCTFEIETECYQERFGSFWHSAKIHSLVGAARTGNETWFLFVRRNDGKLLLAAMRDNNRIVSCTETPLSGSDFSGKPDVIARAPAPFTVNDRYAVIGDLKGNLHCFDRNLGKWIRIAEFSPVPLISLLLFEDRIWGLCGAFLYKNNFCTLISCSVDGSDRQIHFSTARAEPQNELDALRLRDVNSLIAVENSLFFTLTSENNTMVYRYSPETKKFDSIKKFLFTGAGIDTLWEQQGKIYCFTMGHGERIYRIDPQNRKTECIFNQTGKKYKFDNPAERPAVLRGGGWQMNRPWQFSENKLYSANYTPGVITLDSPEKSPLLWLPACSYVFETSRGMLFLGYHRYFIVKEKKQ